MGFGMACPPGCASTRPWAVGYNAFGVKAPRARCATLGCGIQPLGVHKEKWAFCPLIRPPLSGRCPLIRPPNSQSCAITSLVGVAGSSRGQDRPGRVPWPNGGRGGYPPRKGARCRGVSDELDVVSHVLRLQEFPEEHESRNNLANGTPLLMAISDACVLSSLVVEHQKVFIVCEGHAPLRKRKGQMVFVRSIQQAGVGSGRDIHCAAAKTCGNGIGHMLIHMEAK